MQYTYDVHGNLTQLTYPDNKTVTYIYDLHDRLVTVRDWANRITQYNVGSGQPLATPATP